MKILSVYDPEFADYGRVVDGWDTKPFVDALNRYTPLPENGTGYVPEEPALQNLDASKELAPTLFGGLPVQFGWCNGHNTKLNCLEYHRNSEFNLPTEDIVLILAKESQVKDGRLDTSLCRAFRVPAGVLVEVYGTSLHYAPCHTDPAKGFRVLIALPKGTNDGKAEPSGRSAEDRMLFATNKWLIAHPDAPEASQGAWVGLTGVNPDIAADL